MISLREKLADPETLVNCQVNVIASAVATQAIAAAGADMVVIDMEHGAAGYPEAHAMIAATKGTACSPLVRVPEIDESCVKRVLDLGAEGVIFPLIKTADDVRAALAMLRYPPRGTRGWGPFIAHSHWATNLMDYQTAKGDDMICGLLLETPEAVENIEEICSVEGIDFVIIAGFDLSSTMGLSGQFDHPDFLAAQTKLETAVLAAGIPLGAAAFDRDHARALLGRGYRILGGFDVLSLKASVAALSSWLK